MESFKLYIRYVFDKIVGNLIWAILILLGGGIITYLSSRHFQFTNLEIVLMIIILSFLLGIIAYICYRINRRIPNFGAIESNFHIIKEERIHEWLNNTDYIHTRRYHLKALKSGVSYYDDKFRWTGISYELSGGESDDYTLELIQGNRNVFDLYRFNFTKPLKKGDTIELEAIWKAKGPANPFFSTTITEPTDLLVMTVMLYPDSNIRCIYCDIAHTFGGTPTATKQMLNEKGKYIWEIKNPQLLHSYEINWKKK